MINCIARQMAGLEGKMEWTAANALRRSCGEEPSLYVAGSGKDFLVQHMQNLPGDPRVVDFGVFAGRNLPPLIEAAGERGQVIGVDHIEAFPIVQSAKQKYPGVTFVFGVMAPGGIPIPFESISGAICWRVLHNLVKPGELYRGVEAIHKLLRPGAPLVAAVRALPGPCQASTEPILMEASNGAGETRGDLYFTAPAARHVFEDGGFILSGEPAIVEETSCVNGNKATWAYWALRLIRR